MTIAFECPMCGATETLRDEAAGRTITCPKCSEPVKLPARVASPYRSPGFITASVVSALLCIGAGIFIGFLLGERPIVVEKEVIVENPSEKVAEVGAPAAEELTFTSEEPKKISVEEERKYWDMLALWHTIRFPDGSVEIEPQKIRAYVSDDGKWEAWSCSYDLVIPGTDTHVPGFVSNLKKASDENFVTLNFLSIHEMREFAVDGTNLYARRRAIEKANK